MSAFVGFFTEAVYINISERERQGMHAGRRTGQGMHAGRGRSSHEPKWNRVF